MPPANPRIIALFDVDGTLTPARKDITPETAAFIKKLREKITIGVVGGSDFPKQKEQLGETVLEDFDYSFSENGLVAYHKGKQIGHTSINDHLGEENIKAIVNWTLRYLSDLDIPIKRGTFIEYRTGMLNISPIGRNCNREERNAFEVMDLENGVRKTMVEKMRKKFANLDLTFSIGGQISFDLFPKGWDKTYCLRYLAEGDFDEVHFFGDKTFEGGNDHEIFVHPRVIGHTVTCPEDTVKQLRELFFR
ncbi:phosphomannomutase a1 [Nannochloropsis oceanica]